MDAEIFWEIIGSYNQQTWLIQIVFMITIALSLVLALLKKFQWLPKIFLGMANIFVGIVFFIIFGTETIQHFFAAPLFIATGVLFIWEGKQYSHDVFLPFNKLQWSLLVLVILYPMVSMLLGNSFPQMVVYIMPCPLISFSIIVYSGYSHKNKILLLLLMIWGLTGIKSFFFNALEDIILLTCGIYCIWLLVTELKKMKIAI